MKKSSLFISAVLTTFILTILAGTLTAAKVFASNGSQVNLQQATQVAQADTSTLSPQQAALLAAQYLGRNDLYSAESANFNGANTYKITFSSGYVVYVGLNGQILSVQSASPVITQNTTAKPVIPTWSTTYEAGDGD
jgi:hypothetical protein